MNILEISYVVRGCAQIESGYSSTMSRPSSFGEGSIVSFCFAAVGAVATVALGFDAAEKRKGFEEMSKQRAMSPGEMSKLVEKSPVRGVYGVVTGELNGSRVQAPHLENIGGKPIAVENTMEEDLDTKQTTEKRLFTFDRETGERVRSGTKIHHEWIRQTRELQTDIYGSDGIFLLQPSDCTGTWMGGHTTELKRGVARVKLQGRQFWPFAATWRKYMPGGFTTSSVSGTGVVVNNHVGTSPDFRASYYLRQRVLFAGHRLTTVGKFTQSPTGLGDTQELVLHEERGKPYYVTHKSLEEISASLLDKYKTSRNWTIGVGASTAIAIGLGFYLKCAPSTSS